MIGLFFHEKIFVVIRYDLLFFSVLLFLHSNVLFCSRDNKKGQTLQLYTLLYHKRQKKQWAHLTFLFEKVSRVFFWWHLSRELLILPPYPYRSTVVCWPKWMYRKRIKKKGTILNFDLYMKKNSLIERAQVR